ncbi:hypothetical protein RCL1_006012 [Eukaryota sp. TZLM3-RCL]
MTKEGPEKNKTRVDEISKLRGILNEQETLLNGLKVEKERITEVYRSTHEDHHALNIVIRENNQQLDVYQEILTSFGNKYIMVDEQVNVYINNIDKVSKKVLNASYIDVLGHINLLLILHTNVSPKDDYIEELYEEREDESDITKDDITTRINNNIHASISEDVKTAINAYSVIHDATLSFQGNYLNTTENLLQTYSRSFTNIPMLDSSVLTIKTTDYDYDAILRNIYKNNIFNIIANKYIEASVPKKRAETFMPGVELSDTSSDEDHIGNSDEDALTRELKPSVSATSPSKKFDTSDIVLPTDELETKRTFTTANAMNADLMSILRDSTPQKIIPSPSPTPTISVNKIIEFDTSDEGPISTISLKPDVMIPKPDAPHDEPTLTKLITSRSLKPDVVTTVESDVADTELMLTTVDQGAKINLTPRTLDLSSNIPKVSTKTATFAGHISSDEPNTTTLMSHVFDDSKAKFTSSAEKIQDPNETLTIADLSEPIPMTSSSTHDTNIYHARIQKDVEKKYKQVEKLKNTMAMSDLNKDTDTIRNYYRPIYNFISQSKVYAKYENLNNIVRRDYKDRFVGHTILQMWFMYKYITNNPESYIINNTLLITEDTDNPVVDTTELLLNNGTNIINELYEHLFASETFKVIAAPVDHTCDEKPINIKVILDFAKENEINPFTFLLLETADISKYECKPVDTNT